MKDWILIWLSKRWWDYILQPKDSRSDISKFKVIWCRIRGHRAGVWWENTSGYEPNMHCKNCEDNLG